MEQWTPSIVYKDPKTLIPYSRNAKVHTKSQVEKIANSIDKFGFTQPIVVDSDDVIILGHGRREAAIALNLKKVPVFIANHLTEDQSIALRITDNRVADAPWDVDLLRFDITSLNLHNFNLDVLGFEKNSLDKLLNNGEILPELLGGNKIADGTEEKYDLESVQSSQLEQDISGEWVGMPEFTQEDKDAFRTIKIHFTNQQDIEYFSTLIEQSISEKTKFLWFPKIENNKLIGTGFKSDQ